MSFIKYPSMQASNYSYITCIVCSIKLPCSVEHRRAANTFSKPKLGKNNSFEWGWRKKIPLTLQPICTDEWA